MTKQDNANLLTLQGVHTHIGAKSRTGYGLRR